MRVRLLQTLIAATVLVGTAAIAAPPPWAPAHGYRYRNLDGLELVYDARHGLWEVLAIAGLYYLEGRYWRHVHDHWEWSDRHHDGRWRVLRDGHEPPALRGWHPPPHRDRERGYDRVGRGDDRGHPAPHASGERGRNDHRAPPHRNGPGGPPHR